MKVMLLVAMAALISSSAPGEARPPRVDDVRDVYVEVLQQEDLYKSRRRPFDVERHARLMDTTMAAESPAGCVYGVRPDDAALKGREESFRSQLRAAGVSRDLVAAFIAAMRARPRPVPVVTLERTTLHRLDARAGDPTPPEVKTSWRRRRDGMSTETALGPWRVSDVVFSDDGFEALVVVSLGRGGRALALTRQPHGWRIRARVTLWIAD